MGASIIINLLVYTHNDGSPVTPSIGLKINIYDSTNNSSSGLAVDNDWVYTPGGPKKQLVYGLQNNG